MESTNLNSDAGESEGSLCNWIKLKGVNVLLVPNDMGEPTSANRAPNDMGEPTSANTAPNLILPSITLSVAPVISGEYSFNKFSSLWSDARRGSAYGAILAGWDG